MVGVEVIDGYTPERVAPHFPEPTSTLDLCADLLSRAVLLTGGAMSTTAQRAPWHPAEPICVDEASFAAITCEATLPVVTLFSDARSAACRRIEPDVHDLAGQLAGRAIFLKVKADQHPQLGYEFGVGSVPHLLLLRDGKVLSELAGATSQAELQRWLCAYVDPAGERPLCSATYVKVVTRILQAVAMLAGLLSAASGRKEVRA